VFTVALLKLELRLTRGELMAFLGVLGGAGRRGLGDSGRSGSATKLLKSEPDLEASPLSMLFNTMQLTTKI